MSDVSHMNLEQCKSFPSITRNTVSRPFPSLANGKNDAVAVALQYLDGSSVLLTLDIKPRDNGDIVFNQAKDPVCRAFATHWLKNLAAALFTTLTVGTAQIQQVIACEGNPVASKSPGSSPPYSRVFLQDFVHSPLLTEAFHDPQLLYRESPSLAFGDFRPTPYKKVTDTLEGHQVIVVRRIIDKFKIAWLLVSFLILSPCLGIVVGTCSHNADVGVAVSAGVFALASFVQGLIAWVQR